MKVSPRIHRASLAQESIWLSPNAASLPSPFNLLWAVRLKGALEPPALASALTGIVRRHEVLRSTYRWADGRLEQLVWPPAEVELGMEACGSPAESHEIAAAFGEAPYDLAEGALWRFKLLRLQPDEHRLLCGFHHMVFDGGSWPLFVEELQAALAGEVLPEPPSQVHDIFERRAAGLAGQDEARAYWRDRRLRLEGCWEAAPDDQTGGRRSTDGGHISCVLPGPLATKLRAAASRLGSTPFRVALAAFVAYMGLVSRRDDVVVATTLTGRAEPDTRSLIGMFVSTAIVAADIGEGATFKDLVAQVHAEVDAAVAHQDFPFRLALREAGAAWDATRNPFTEASFTKMPRATCRRVGDLELSDERVVLSGADRDLSIFLQETGAGVVLTWTYRPSRFEAATVARYAGQFQTLLAEALAHPDQPLDRLDLTTEPERRKILSELSGADFDLGDAKPLHRLFEDQAARTPERVAVVSPERVWRYREIDAAANALALVLRARGVGPGSFVPLMAPVSAELVIAQLATLKCGAAFAPLAMDWPAVRIDALLGQLGTRLAVTRNAREARTAPADCDLVDMSCIDLETVRGPVSADCGLDDPIYCIFTSGSTGAPKGAVNRHRGIVNRLQSMSHVFGSGRDEVVLATSASIADSLIWQIYWPLTGGGRVIMSPHEQVIAPDHLLRLIQDHSVTTIDFTPSIFQRLAQRLEQEPWLPSLDALRRVLIGGEAMNPAPVYAFRAMYPDVELLNTYGPTETSIGVTYGKVPAAYTDIVPIGRPYPNIRMVVLDSLQRLRPLGMAGELCLGGVCVGLGYLGDPAATREKFVANPFPELGCDILYRTGDLARMRPDGTFECLGRIDDQIKIRGARIEPGEIEAALVRHPAVKQAVVSRAAGEGGEEPRLVARLVLAEHEPRPDAHQLQAFLLERLPALMAPSTFIRVDRLPLAPGGKVDRRAAASLEGEPLTHERTFEAPRTELESCIAEIWRELLQREPIGVHDNFFTDLNGDSMKALTFVLGFEERTGRRTEIARVYEAPTIAAFAVGLAGGSEETAPPATADLVQGLLHRQRPYLAAWKGARMSPDSLLFALNPGGVNHPLFWCCQGFHELSQLAARLGPDQPVVGMRSGHLIMELTEANIDALASHYAREVDLAQAEGAIHLGGNCQGGAVALAVSRRLRQEGREVSLLVLMEETEFRPYDGRVALLFGEDSHLNPYNRATDPEAIFRSAYSGGYTVATIPGAHGSFFWDQHVAGLAATVAARLKDAAPRVAASLWTSAADISLRADGTVAPGREKSPVA